MKKDRIPITAFFNPEEALQLRIAAARKNVSRSEFLRLAVRSFIEKHEAEEDQPVKGNGQTAK